MTVEKYGNKASDPDSKIFLEKHVDFKALHDSSQFKTASRCHPSTQQSVLGPIAQWADEIEGTWPILRLKGASGVGKSTVVLTVFDRLIESGYLATSFFLSWTSSYSTKRHSFTATIAYQIVRLFPEAWPVMASTISRHPELFEQPISRQFQTLIVPAISETGCSTQLLVVIDGLDECCTSEDEKYQRTQFLDELAHIVQAHSSIRILLTTGPDPDIETTFQLPPLSTYTKQITIPDGAIQCPETKVLLEKGLGDLRRTRCLESSWPTHEQISELVALCQGSFISASTAMRFICSPSMDPPRSLWAVLQLSTSLPAKDSARVLDALYGAILQVVPSSQSEVVSAVLGIVCSLKIGHENDPLERIFTGLTAKSPSWLEKLLHLPEGRVHDSLQALDAVLKLPARADAGRVPIYLRHSSFRDFLLDPDRSGRFCIDQATTLLHLQINLMKHTFIILSDPHPESGYDERAVVKIFLEGLNHDKCPASKELKLGIEAHMNRSDEVYYRYLETIHLEHLGPKRRIRLNLLITPKEELQVLRYLQRCNTKDLEPSSWRRWLDTLNLQPQIALLATALD